MRRGAESVARSRCPELSAPATGRAAGPRTHWCRDQDALLPEWRQQPPPRVRVASPGHARSLAKPSKPQLRMQSPPSTRKPWLPSAEDHRAASPAAARRGAVTCTVTAVFMRGGTVARRPGARGYAGRARCPDTIRRVNGRCSSATRRKSRLGRVPWIMGRDLAARSGSTRGRRCPGT